MKKTAITVVSMLCLLLFVTFVGADTIYLKDGSVIKGKITEETEYYVEILIEKEGIRASTKIPKEKIARIERDSTEPSAEPSPSGSGAVQPTEEPKDSLDQARKMAPEALDFYAKKDYDKFLRTLVRMMALVATSDGFKDVYQTIETPLKRAIPDLLEDETKRQCNAVPHVAQFKRLCPSCAGKRTITKIVNDKETKVPCPTCKGTGGVDCETCKARIELAKLWRKKVRYTEEEMAGIVYLQIVYGDIAHNIVDQALNKAISSEKVYCLEDEAQSKKLEVRLRKPSVDEFADRLNTSGLKISRSATQKNTFIIKYK